MTTYLKIEALCRQLKFELSGIKSITIDKETFSDMMVGYYNHVKYVGPAVFEQGSLTMFGITIHNADKAKQNLKLMQNHLDEAKEALEKIKPYL